MSSFDPAPGRDGRHGVIVPKVPAVLRPGISRRGLILRGLGAGLGAAALSGVSTAVYAGGIEPERLVTTSYRLTPPGWTGGRVSLAAIADLHAGGPNMAVAHIARVVDETNALSPDIIVLLGDYIATHRFVTEHVPNDVWAAELARLKAPLGVWAILGNHDWWNNVRSIRGALVNAGIPCLENRAMLVGEGTTRFWIAGLGDQIAHRLGPGSFRGQDDLAGTLAQVTTDDPVILLAHEPDIFVRVPPRVCLTLAGHTHGGQVRIPLLWPHLVPSRYGARFAYGHIVERNRHMIVSGGLGTSFAPVRLGVPPEIVHVEIGGGSAV
jgi:predicted MPP superfamily phosphohydrolase